MKKSPEPMAVSVSSRVVEAILILSLILWMLRPLITETIGDI
jgi:hypothetical protein